MGLFGKVDRVLKAQRERNRSMGIDPDKRKESPELEKNDFFALWLSAMLTIFPAALGALALIGFIAWLLIPK